MPVTPQINKTPKLPGKPATPCPMGTYSDKVNLATADACLPCQQGFYCGKTGQKTSDTPCADGHYCGGGAKVGMLFCVFQRFMVNLDASHWIWNCLWVVKLIF